MKKCLYLHIGMGKTGTTALQDFFWGNRKLLASYDIDYPKYGAVANAHHLISPHMPPWLKDSWDFKTVSEWAPELAKSPQQRILLSSELIAWAEEDAIRRFCTELSDWFEIKVVLYLRRQDNIIMASYNQQVKAGPQRRRIDQIYLEHIDKFDYLKILSPWAESIGRENIIVRPYERQQFHAEDIRRDFMYRVFDVELDARFTLSTIDSNPRLSQDAGEYKRLVNSLVDDEKKNNRFNELLMQYSQKLNENPNSLFSQQDVLSPVQRLEILEATRDATESIARDYMGRTDGRLFHDPIPNPDDPWLGIDLSPNDVAVVTQFLQKHDPKLVRWLTDQTREYWNAKRPIKMRAARLLGDSLLSEEDRPLNYALAEEDRAPVVVGGLGGSGTRLVVRVLQELGVAMDGQLNESLDNLWFSLLFVRRSVLLKSDEELRQLAWVFTNAMRHGNELPQEFKALVEDACRHDRGPVLPKPLLEELRDSILEAGTPANSSQYWGWKQPNTHVMLPQLFRCFPRMKYIYVVRNGLDMAFSDNQNQLKYFWGDLMLEGDTSVTPRNALRYWVASHKRMRSYKPAFGDSPYFLNFDRLCADPLLELGKLTDFLQLEVEDDKLAELAATISPPATVGRFRDNDCSKLRPVDVEFVREQGFIVV